MGLFDRRKYDRFDFQKEITIFADSPMQNKSIEYYAKTINISQGGLLIYTIAEFKEKTPCTVRFKSNKLKLIEKKGKILRIVTEDRPDQLKEIEKMYAMEFSDPFTTDQLVDIIEKLGT